MSGRSSLPTQWRRWPAEKMHQASTLERGLVMVYLCSTFKMTHWLGHWTSRSQGGKKKQFDHISIDGGAPFFFYVSRATSDPARQWCTVPHVAKLNVISPNGQIPLDELSSKLTTFLTPWGAYRFLRNAMGLSSAGDEHNRRGDEALSGMSNFQKVVEDVIIYNQDVKSHVNSVREALRRCADAGITLHKEKFVFAKQEVDYCGFTVSPAGYRPDDRLIKALTEFPTPQNRTDVRSFCGLAQQFEAFTPWLTEVLAPIRCLLSPKAEFVWESVHQKAFESAIRELTSPRVLATYDGQSRLRLETDAAQSTELGMALWQEHTDSNGTSWRLLQCSSRSTSEAETRYSATEIELLAVVWACKKASLFLFGNDFEVVVDHRPLIPILNSKTLGELSSPRIIRLKEKLAPYNLTAVWRAGVSHKTVDCLSRHPVDSPEDADLHGESELDNCLRVFKQIANLDIDTGRDLVMDQHLDRILSAGNSDLEYTKLRTMIGEGFPVVKRDLDPEFHPYWESRADLAIDSDGTILQNGRLLVPRPLRREVLKDLHSSHQGQSRTLQRARQVVFWPNMSNYIKNMVRSCDTCASFLPSQQQEPLHSHDIPVRPFQHVSADSFNASGCDFLVLVDHFSGWPSVAKLHNSTSTTNVLRQLKRWKTDYGAPVKLVTDNGPQFRSAEFQHFCKEWYITHVTSSPYNPQSNGIAEAAVKSIKYLLLKTVCNGNIDSDAFQEGLLELRNTPRATGHSPAQLVFSRSMRGKIPSCPTRLDSDSALVQNEKQKLKDQRSKSEDYYNRRAQRLPQLHQDQRVLVQHPQTKRWTTQATVIRKSATGRSYEVRDEHGKQFWRNRRMLRPYYGQ